MVLGSLFVAVKGTDSSRHSAAGGRKKAGKAADLENESALPRGAALPMSSGRVPGAATLVRLSTFDCRLPFLSERTASSPVRNSE